MIAFRDRTGCSVVIGSCESRFQFVGQELCDAAENLGPLFGSSPPRMMAAGGSWTDVQTIVVGTESRNGERWRIVFKPIPEMAEQDMPAEIASSKAGWYFVRFYDLQDELIDSLDFRFGAGLQRITVQQSNPFPSAEGHEATTIEFQHDADWWVRYDPRVPEHVKIERADGKTFSTIPPLQDCDRTRWLVGPNGGPQVEVTELVERIWWAASNVNAPLANWLAICLSLSPEDFTATSEEAIWFRFPKPRWTNSVFVGFQPGRWREYVPKVAESTMAIALRDFSDSQELVDRTEDHVFSVWIKQNGTLCRTPVATVHLQVIEESLDLFLLSACRLASVLTALCHTTRGPLRQLFKEVRRQYHRPRHSIGDQNVEFLKEALCSVAVFLQLPQAPQTETPRCVNRWRSRARLASQQFPETMRQVWRRYRELER